MEGQDLDGIREWSTIQSQMLSIPAPPGKATPFSPFFRFSVSDFMATLSAQQVSFSQNEKLLI
jgi:hypothetical protein